MTKSLLIYIQYMFFFVCVDRRRTLKFLSSLYFHRLVLLIISVLGVSWGWIVMTGDSGGKSHDQTGLKHLLLSNLMLSIGYVTRAGTLYPPSPSCRRGHVPEQAVREARNNWLPRRLAGRAGRHKAKSDLAQVYTPFIFVWSLLLYKKEIHFLVNM